MHVILGHIWHHPLKKGPFRLVNKQRTMDILCSAAEVSCQRWVRHEAPQHTVAVGGTASLTFVWLAAPRTIDAMLSTTKTSKS